MTLTEVRQLLTELEIHPSKALGQNFLIDGNILEIIAREADIRATETVLEIGPGLGALTHKLLDRAGTVIAIEKDARLAEYSRQQFPEVKLTVGDAVKVPLPACDKVVANLLGMLTAKGSKAVASILGDMEKGGAAEGKQIIGDMLGRARKHGIAAPNLRYAYAHLQTYEARRARGGLK